MLRHDHVTDDDEAVAFARLLQNRKEAVASPGGIQQRQSSVAGTSDEVQVVRPLAAMQTAGHNSP
jgi:hypothetical protein